MKIIIENLTESALSVPLPDGGTVPAEGSRTFSDIDEATLAQAIDELDALVDAASATVHIRPDGDESDFGGRVYREMLRVRDEDLTAEAQTEAIEGAYTLPERATLMGFRKTVAQAYANGTLIDAGFSGAGLGDVLDDGQSLASLGDTYGAGANALPLVRRSIGGQKLKVTVDAGDGNTVADLAAGDATVTIFYVIH